MPHRTSSRNRLLRSNVSEVRIEADDRVGLERLLRYCARPAFALERLREIDPGHLVYESAKPGPGGNVSLLLTPMQLLDRLAALIPPPRLLPARGPPLWETQGSESGEIDPQAQPAPDYEFDQRVAW